MDFRDYVRTQLPPLVIAREPEIIDELAQHLSDLYEEGRAEGLDHDTALARAAAAMPAHSAYLKHEIETATRALPGLIADRWHASLAEPVSTGSSSMLSDLRRDLRHAVRLLLRAPGFTFVVVLTLALGIGANAVIFSAIDAVLLRGVAVSDPDRLVSVYTTSGNQPFSTSSYPDYVDLRDSGAFESLTAFAGIPLTLDIDGRTEPLAGEIVSANYFYTLGVSVPIGRAFTAEEDRPGSPARVVVLSHAAWQRHFGADRSIVGRTIRLNGNPYTVVGVAARGFGGPILGRATEAWVPTALQPEVRQPSAGLRRSLGHSRLLEARGLRWMNVVGRLRSGDSPQQAGAAAQVIASRLEAVYPRSNRERRFTVIGLGEGPGVRQTTRPLLKLLGTSVVLVLLIACANVASLLLARAVTRRREVAVRMAVGAGRSRLVRQWLAESVLLALLGSAGALLIAWWGSPVLYTFGIPASVDLAVNPRVLLFTLAVAVGSGVLFGLAPVIQTLRSDTISALRDEGGAVATGVRAARMRSAFVVMQVALSLVLLVGAVLFLRTLKNAYSVELGYEVDRTLLADINLDLRGYSPDAGQSVYEQILTRVKSIPGVEAAGAARVTVLSGGSRVSGVSTNGQPIARDGSNSMDVRTNVISHDYLAALGIPVIRGRGFDRTDHAGSPKVAVVSSSLVRRLWPDADPIGATLINGSESLQVIGVVPDTVYTNALERDSPPFFYSLLAQGYESGVTLHVRTAGDPLSLVGPVREAVRQVDNQLVVGRPRLLREELDRSLSRERMMGTLIGLFGGVALMLAVVGLYGVMTHLTSQRRVEIGIRLAMGAQPSRILSLVMLQGLRLVGIGTAIGLVGALAGARYLESQLFGVKPTDPVTLVVVCAILAIAGLAACLIPARRAMKVDPIVALRHV